MENAADALYRPVMVKKKDETRRECFDAKPPLKAMQARIQNMIMKKVIYPGYLTGGLADPKTPRDYVRNAEAHTGARLMVNEDVAKFFPSTTHEVVYDIWRFVFRFPNEVARTLTRLTTRRGELPQGAKTSSYLANLVFWAHEPRLVQWLHNAGFRYTRYIDDITLSSTADKTREELGQAIGRVASMLRRHGLRFKRSKHHIAYAGERMEVTGLTVGERSVGLSRKSKSMIRASVRQCELAAKKGIFDDAMQKRVASLVGQYTRLHRNKGKALKLRLAPLEVSRKLPVIEPVVSAVGIEPTTR